jgi:hypothetical protein
MATQPILKTISGTGAYQRLADSTTFVRSVVLEPDPDNASDVTVRVYGSSDSATISTGQYSPELYNVDLYNIEANIASGDSLIVWGSA